MKNKKWIRAAAILLLSAVCLAGCGSDDKKSDSTEVSWDTIDQTGKPEKGEEIAVMKIAGMGEIKIRFFPEAAPKAVENFITHAKEGYYDGVIFHRVIEDFMIQGGDPTGTGAGGESIWGEFFEDECNDVLMPIRGALCMANKGTDTNGSQFFIVQTKSPNTNSVSGLTEQQKALFEENGGTPWLVGAHTVFGQVIEGMDVVDAIAAVETDSDRPVEDVVITSIEIEEY